MTLNKLAAEISKILAEHPELGNEPIAINPQITDFAELEIAKYDEENETCKGALSITASRCRVPSRKTIWR